MNEDKKTLKVSQEDIELAKKAAPADLREQEPVSIFNEILDWVESFVFAMFIIILIFIFLLRIVTVEGESMNATLDDKDRVIITHLNYTPKRDDVVVANSSVLNKTIIKRVIGVGGDTVKIDYNVNKVFVNGEEISNEHINGTMINKGMFDPNYLISDGVYQYKVPDGKVFVMGDNRNNSTDSRTIGFIDNKDVLGHVIFRLYPFKKLGKVK
ncbi:MAG: signal peptidase I [Ruminococcus sp.]|nr:signal peptidase I [Ruminococcus sp.]MBQ9868034.1 signal peptidase I [Ruminococcus sp.]